LALTNIHLMQSSQLFQQRMHNMHLQTAARRQEELELKAALALAKKRQQKKGLNNAKKAEGERASSSLSRFLFRLWPGRIFSSSNNNTPQLYSSYSRFARADQLWENISSGAEEAEEVEDGEDKC